MTVFASILYKPVFGTIGAGGGAGGRTAWAETICTSTQPPQSRWSRTETVQSAVSPTASPWLGSVHVTTPSSPAFMPGHGYCVAWPSFVHVQPLAAVSLAPACVWPAFSPQTSLRT